MRALLCFMENKGLITIESLPELIDYAFKNEPEFAKQLKTAIADNNDQEISNLMLVRVRNVESMMEVDMLKQVHQACINRDRFQACVVVDFKKLKDEMIEDVAKHVMKVVKDKRKENENE